MRASLTNVYSGGGNAVEHLRPGGVDRFPQSLGRRRLVSTPLWSLRSPTCPLWLIIGKAALRFGLCEHHTSKKSFRVAKRVQADTPCQ